MTPVNSRARSCLLAGAFAVLGAHAAQADASLAGCWRSASIVMQFQGGAQSEDRSGRCTLQFEDDRILSTCQTSTGSAVTRYRYEIVRPNVYRATMTGSSFRTDLVGSTREYEYRIDGDKLLLVTHPQTTSPAPPSAAVRVESESKREACP
jgi:hypothetical protein